MPLVLAVPGPGRLAVFEAFCDLRPARVAAACAAELAATVLEPLASRPWLFCVSWKAARRVLMVQPD